MHEMLEITQPRIQALKNWILDRIPYEDPAFRGALEIRGFTEIVRAYIDYSSRLVVPRKRTAHFDQEFWTSDIAANNHDAIMELQSEIEQGEDLHQRLSKKVNKEGYNPSVGWKGKDFALNAYDVHHLHLKKGIHGGNSKELVFIKFEPDDAKFIFAGDHASFDKPELEEAILNHRAQNGELVLNGVFPPVQSDFQSDGRHRLARAGRFTTMDNVNGKATIAANVTNAGTSNRYAIHANKVLSCLSKLEHSIDTEMWSKTTFEQNKLIPPKQPEFEWMFEGTSLFLVEKSTQTCFPLIVSPQGLSDNLLNRE